MQLFWNKVRETFTSLAEKYFISGSSIKWEVTLEVCVNIMSDYWTHA